MRSYDLSNTLVVVLQLKDYTINITALKPNIVSELYKENLYNLEEKIDSLIMRLSINQNLYREWI